MHRRALSPLAKASPGLQHALCRYQSTLHKRPPPQPHQDVPKSHKQSSQTQQVAKALQRVLSPEACAVLEGKRIKSRKGGNHTAPLVSTERPLPPSMEKLAFEASEPSTDVSLFQGGRDGEAFEEMSERFPAGTFVEIRRNGVSAFGIVVFTMLLDRKWMVHSITDRGELWSHQEHDVQFQIPDFASKSLMEKCGLLAEPADGEQMDARVESLKLLRGFEKKFETVMHGVLEKARSVDFYALVAHRDPKTWSQITIQEAAERLVSSRPITPIELLAAQTYLMNNGIHYAATQRRFLKKQIFWVRPREQVEVINVVQKLSLANDPALDSFAKKARALVLASRQRERESFHEPPSRHPIDAIELTETDKIILRFLRASLQVMRHIQTDPYTIAFAQIIKKTGLYNLDIYDDSSVYQLLTEMGVLAPWEETVTRGDAPREERDNVTLRPSIPTPLLPEPLGPEDFYNRDVVDALRYDFGDTPVYVIDDWGAEELDDGVSIEKIPSDPAHLWLHVHIADPTTLLPPTHRISLEAFRISSSSYLIDRTIRMLPDAAGFHQFSLGQKPSQPDKVMTFSCKVNMQGDIVDYQVRSALIRNVKTLKYDVIDAALGVQYSSTLYPFSDAPPNKKLLDTSSIGPASLETLKLLVETTRKMLYARVRKGAITMSLPQVELEFSHRPLPDDILGSKSLTPYAFRGFPDISYGVQDIRERGARLLVSESMRAACRVASRFFRDRGIPALRRSVGPMRSEFTEGVESLMKSRDEDGYVDYYSSVAKFVSSPTARYLTTPGAHTLLGVPEGEGYVKVTSPLRRFGDLFAHWQIKHALLAAAGDKTSPVLWSEEWLEVFGYELETRELEVKRAERIQHEYWAHLYIQRFMRNSAQGTRVRDQMQQLTGRLITTPNLNTRTRENNCQVYIPMLALKGLLVNLPLDLTLALGDEVKVQVKEIRLGARPILELVLRQ
ncbi:RNB-domain-containing protein [Trametes gibbosa]|nr:RNB-domain-containing protein [Trametes gibbosa]